MIGGNKAMFQWIGLREKLQETMVFTIKYGVFRLKFSPKPIHWMFQITNQITMVFPISQFQTQQLFSTHGWGFGGSRPRWALAGVLLANGTGPKLGEVPSGDPSGNLLGFTGNTQFIVI